MSIAQMLLMAATSPVAPGNSLNIAAGTYTNETTSSCSVPTGAAVGDLLILMATNGAPNAALPSGFTSLYSTLAGVIGWRIMQAGDSSFSLPQSSYATMFAVHGSQRSPVVDSFTATALVTSSETIQTPSATPTSPADLAFMLWMNADGAQQSPAPSLTNLITYNVEGAGQCGMAVSYEQLSSAAAITGDSCGTGGDANYPAMGATLLIK